MFFATIVIMIVLVVALMFAIAGSHHEYYGLRQSQSTIQLKKFKKSKLEEFEQKYSLLANRIGEGSFPRLVLCSTITFALSCFILGPWLTNAQFGVFLGLVIAVAYVSRFYFVIATKFREKLLSQLERILISIRNNLSTGMTLDYAVNDCVKYNQEAPLGAHLKSFVKLSEGNFLERFPLWLANVQRTFKLKELAESSQLLGLELVNTSNQEDAFISAAKHIANRRKANKRQKNTLNISFFTLDFMVAGFFALVFYIIPSISQTWWASDGRPLVMFQTALMVWGAYAITVIISLWRQV